MAESSLTQDVDGSLNAGSEVTFDIICFTCNSKGNIQEAEGYCLDCCEHLCTACLKYHIVFSATKHHKIIDKENMQGKQNISSVSSICTERCQIHKDEIIKFVCTTHNVFVCSICVSLKHELCNDLIYIPEAAANLSDSKEFKDFQNKLDDLIKKSEYIAKAAQSNINLSAEYRAKAMKEIETYRQELNDMLDKLKEELERQSEEIEMKDTKKLTIVVDTSNQVLADLQRMASDIKYLLDKKQYCKLFIDMKNTGDKLADFQDRLPKAEDIFITAVRFQPNLELQKLIKSQDNFGKFIVKSTSEINATFLTDINVTSLGYWSYFTPSVFNVTSAALPGVFKATSAALPDVFKVTSAALLSEDKLVTIDESNKSVKLIDTEHKRIISEYKLNTLPWDVTIMDKTQVAVTLPDAKKIQFMKSDNKLRPGEEITFNKKCWYVARADDKLVVSFSEPCGVRLLNMAGEVLQTFVTSSQGDKLFSEAPRLSVSSFNQAIYASDWMENRVTMLDMDGNVRTVYEDADLKWPFHTAVDDTGMIYLCGKGSNNIHLLTPDCRRVKILLSECDGIHGPLGICYCKVSRRLYIAMARNDYIKVFQLS